MIELNRDDGFTLIFSDAGGWDLYAPSADLSEIEDIIAQIDRRDDPIKAADFSRGQWFGWVADMADAEPKIEDEKRFKLFHH